MPVWLTLILKAVKVTGGKNDMLRGKQMQFLKLLITYICLAFCCLISLKFMPFSSGLSSQKPSICVFS
jgi:hypothetical protein